MVIILVVEVTMRWVVVNILIVTTPTAGTAEVDEDNRKDTHRNPAATARPIETTQAESQKPTRENPR